MKTGFLLLFLLTSGLKGFSQSTVHKNAVDVFLLRYNENDFNGIYESFSTKMREAHTKEYYLSFFSRVKQEYGRLTLLELLQYKETASHKTRGEYNGNFESGNLTVRISTDSENRIIGLYFLKGDIFL
ncbi:DUF3887 domain-containing protein [Flavobacterium sp.]|uniref:DUF3887 domain-containing protein n=1 Tax=Flavobacterium sp. TaxID=239 RepID=UPI00261A5311|nr:DUF3887 domain-containing protein [Flavobacterium sp.]